MENNEEEFAHYGVKGMKWGVRRYMNEDGTLTESGKKRYRNANQSIMKSDYYNERQVNSLPGKQRRATKKYLKDRVQSEYEAGKKAYKELGGKKAYNRLMADGPDNFVDIVNGKKVDAKTVEKIDNYIAIKGSRRAQRSDTALLVLGSAFLTASIAKSVSDTVKRINR